MRAYGRQLGGTRTGAVAHSSPGTRRKPGTPDNGLQPCEPWQGDGSHFHFVFHFEPEYLAHSTREGREGPTETFGRAINQQRKPTKGQGSYVVDLPVRIAFIEPHNHAFDEYPGGQLNAEEGNRVRHEVPHKQQPVVESGVLHEATVTRGFK